MSQSSLQAQPYHSLHLYPQLAGLNEHFAIIKSEAIAALHQMTFLEDRRACQETWRVLPLLPEEEDRDVIPKEIQDFAKLQAPRTFQLLQETPGIKAFLFSTLAPHSRIAPHNHDNPDVTAMLTLQCNGEAYILNNGERRDFVEGEIIIFDYTMMHEVVNNSDEERIVLLMLLDNALR